MDKYSAEIYKLICEKYKNSFEELFNVFPDEYDSIKNGREKALFDLYCGVSKRFKNQNELELYFKNLTINLLNKIVEEYPELYNAIISELDKQLKKNSVFNKQNRIIIPNNSSHLSLVDYYNNYIKYIDLIEVLLGIINIYKNRR